MALLLKALTYLGFVPDSLDGVPHEVRSFIAGQLGLLWDFSEQYRWESRTRDQHLLDPAAHRLAVPHGSGQGRPGTLAARGGRV